MENKASFRDILKETKEKARQENRVTHVFTPIPPFEPTPPTSAPQQDSADKNLKTKDHSASSRPKENSTNPPNMYSGLISSKRRIKEENPPEIPPPTFVERRRRSPNPPAALSERQKSGEDDKSQSVGASESLETQPDEIRQPPENRFAALSSRKRSSRDFSSLVAGATESVKTEPEPDEPEPNSLDADSKRRRISAYAPPKRLASRPAYSFDTKSPIETRTTAFDSSWYDSIDMKQKYSRSDLYTVSHIITLINKAEVKMAQSGNAEQQIQDIRRRLHQMEFYDFLSGVLVKKSRVLDDGEGLPCLFEPGSNFPWDIRADALALYLRWIRGILDPHLLRGVQTEQLSIKSSGKSRKSHKLIPDYPGIVSCNVVGHNNLVNGQWWPLQLCAKRDGAHGEIEAGIHGQVGKGAYSAVMSSAGYADVDEGDHVLYCGTVGKEGQPSDNTKHMKMSFTLKQPIRLLRSSKISSKYKPAKGLRYDGLYDIIACENIDPQNAMYRFTLQRQEGQDPIRFEGNEARPTNEEIAEYLKIRHLLGMA
ncbi:MAG: hypothetical protein M1829_002718 [Trizodia sp. TS-e1964]|nr:MAG: hypothetical protein M1829_002718 [Trizodia sp. TS-e1964]